MADYDQLIQIDTTGLDPATLATAYGSGQITLNPAGFTFNLPASQNFFTLQFWLPGNDSPDPTRPFSFTINPQASTYTTTAPGDIEHPDSLASAIIDDDPAPQPTNLTATPFSNTAITLNWQDNSPNETGFLIEKSADGVNWSQVQIAPANSTTAQIEDLDPNTDYLFRAKADNQAASAQSDPTPAALTATEVTPLDPENLINLGTYAFNADGSPVTDNDPLPILEDGLIYRLTAYGTPTVDDYDESLEGDDGQRHLPYGDPEYAYDYSTPVQTDTNNQGQDLGLRLTGGTQGTMNFWGSFRNDHTYTRDVTGDGTPLNALFHDGDLSDNAARVYLQVQQIVPRFNGFAVADALFGQNSASNAQTLTIGTDANSVNVKLTGFIPATWPANAMWAVSDPVASSNFEGVSQEGVLNSIGNVVPLTIGTDTHPQVPNIAVVGIGIDIDADGHLQGNEVQKWANVQIIQLTYLQATDASNSANFARTPTTTSLTVVEAANDPAKVTLSVGSTPSDSSSQAYIKWTVEGWGLERTSYPDGGFNYPQDFWRGDPTLWLRSLNGQRDIKVNVGFDSNLDGTLAATEVLRTVSIHVLKFDTIYTRRFQESDDVYEEMGMDPEKNNGGSVGAGDKYSFKITFSSNPTNAPVKWWIKKSDDAFLMGAGEGSQFSMTVGEAGVWDVFFWIDLNNDNSIDPAETEVLSSFPVRSGRAPFNLSGLGRVGPAIHPTTRGDR